MMARIAFLVGFPKGIPVTPIAISRCARSSSPTQRRWSFDPEDVARPRATRLCETAHVLGHTIRVHFGQRRRRKHVRNLSISVTYVILAEGMTRSAIRLFWRFGSRLDATKIPEILRKVSDPMPMGAAPSRTFRRRF